MKSIFKKIIQYYLKLLTKFVLWRHKPFVIAIAGSTNKTTVKDYVLKFMREKYSDAEVRGNPRSYNTEIGLPLAIMYLESGDSSFIKWFRILAAGTIKVFFQKKFPSKLVLELGTEKKGDMMYLLGIVKPTVAAITNIEGNYSDADNRLDDALEELRMLVRSVAVGGTIILNQDDERVSSLRNDAKAGVVTVGFSERADARISHLATDVKGQSFEFRFQGCEEKVEIQKYGRHFVYAWAMAKVAKSLI